MRIIKPQYLLNVMIDLHTKFGTMIKNMSVKCVDVKFQF